MSTYFEHSDSGPFEPEGHAHLVPIVAAAVFGFVVGFGLAMAVL